MAGDISSFERIPRVDRVRSVMNALADHIERAGMKPGDKLRLETKIIRHKGPMGVGEAVASVDGKVVAQAELTFMVGAAQ